LKDLGGNTIWEDSETKQFYEDIPDLKLFLPGYAFREPPPTTTAAATPEGRFDFSKKSDHHYFCVETETLDPVQIEQEIEKEGLEVTSTTEGAEEEDTTLADIEGRNKSNLILHSYPLSFQMELKKMSARIILN
jgi:regulator of nonsense transcripts 2